MHIDMPIQTDIERIAAARDDLSVSIYMPTNPVFAHGEENRLRARGLFDSAMDQVSRLADRQVAQSMQESLKDLLEDSAFWSYLGRSLAVFVTPSGITEYRLPNELSEYVAVTDRFAITPLLRSVTFPQAAFVLAISQSGARLVKVSADEPPSEVAIPEAPDSAEQAVGLRSIGGRSPYGRIQGDEGRKVRLTQYARAIDHALRPLLNGESLPLIIAATDPILSMYRNLCGYHALAAESIRGNPDELSNTDLAEAARAILDRLYVEELEELQGVFADRRNSSRAVTDLSDLARAASFGAITTLAVDMDARLSGSVDDGGALYLGESDHDVYEEISRRAIATGARVLAVRSSDLPEGISAAGILRYAV